MAHAILFTDGRALRSNAPIFDTSAWGKPDGPTYNLTVDSDKYSSSENINVLTNVDTDALKREFPFVCGNCASRSTSAGDLNPINHLSQRVDPGEEFPAGECPVCGALVYDESIVKPETLTIGDAVVLGDILRSCQANHPCTWLVPDGGGRTLTGTMRAIVKDAENAYLMTGDVDVRDGFVWISATFEHFLPVRDVMRMVSAGAFALNYR